jgi:hypothetical protein
MFETEVRPEPSLVSYDVQQFAAPLLPMLSLLIVSPVLNIFAGSRAELIAPLLFAVCFAFAFGRVVRSHLPGAAEAGRWVWVIPSTVLLAALIGDAVLFSLRQSLSELFFPPREGEGSLGFFLMTIPVFSSIAYSIACANLSRRAQRIIRPD